MVYAYRHFIWISVFCHPPMWSKKLPKYRNFDQIFTFCGAYCAHPLYWSGPNLARNSRPMAYAYMPNFTWIHLLCNLPRNKKLHFWANIDNLGGPVPTPFYQWGPNLVSEPRVGPLSMLMCQISSLDLFCCPLVAKKQILLFWIRHFVMSPNGSIWRKLNAGA